MNISITLDERSSRKDGRHPIKFRFTSGKKSVYVSTGMFAFANEFDKESSLFSLKEKNTREKHRKNNILLTEEHERADRILYDLKRKGQGNIDPTRFKELFLRNSLPNEYSYTSFFQEFVNGKSGRTKEIYQVTFNKIKVFSKSELFFEDIDYSWLKKFESYLRKKGNAINTISIDMRNIRAVYKEANKRKIASKDLYPFDDYKIKQEETEHRAISVEKLRDLFNYSGTDSENWARDVAKLIFLLIGINASDLYNLSFPTNGRVNYRRDKTGRLYSIKLEPEAIKLIEQFKGKDHFLIFQEQFKNKSDFLKKINGETIEAEGKKKYLKRGLNSIGDAIGVEKLTSYVMRHTWGTLAGILEIPKETIAKSLGHGKKTVTDIYVNFDVKKIDEANRKVIDYVFK